MNAQEQFNEVICEYALHGDTGRVYALRLKLQAVLLYRGIIQFASVEFLPPYLPYTWTQFLRDIDCGMYK